MGWSATDLANKAGMGYATVIRFENGSDITRKTRNSLAQVFKDAGVEFFILRGHLGVIVPEPAKSPKQKKGEVAID